PPGGAGAGGPAASGGAAGAYLSNQLCASEGWGPPHTTSGPNPTTSAWSAPAGAQSTHRASSGGWGDDEATDDLAEARSGGLDDDEATDDLAELRSTDRITPGEQGGPPQDPQGTMRRSEEHRTDHNEDPPGTTMVH